MNNPNLNRSLRIYNNVIRNLGNSVSLAASINARYNDYSSDGLAEAVKNFNQRLKRSSISMTTVAEGLSSHQFQFSNSLAPAIKNLEGMQVLVDQYAKSLSNVNVNFNAIAKLSFSTDAVQQISSFYERLVSEAENISFVNINDMPDVTPTSESSVTESSASNIVDMIGMLLAIFSIIMSFQQSEQLSRIENNTIEIEEKIEEYMEIQESFNQEMKTILESIEKENQK